MTQINSHTHTPVQICIPQFMIFVYFYSSRVSCRQSNGIALCWWCVWWKCETYTLFVLAAKNVADPT